jgi:hypothetical protein
MADTYFNLNQDYFNTIFQYKDGNLYWKQRPALCLKVGSLAGTLKKHDPYKRVQVAKKNLLQHRVIFFMHHGYLPDLIDHIDGNRLNNRIENLREATYSQNAINKKLGSNNKSGYKNVCWNKKSRKWTVTLKVDGKIINIGGFDDVELAGLVAQEARNKYYKDFARHQ